MKKMKKILCLLLAFVLTFGCMSGMAMAMEWGTKPADGVTEDQPFASGTGGSTNFRIPCLVTLDDGTIVAACDARWNHAADACGLDTIVSRSTDNGKTWNYTFANYLGDNGNQFSYDSTAFIDPAIATDGETVWMIADIYPAGVAINTVPETHRARPGHTGYDENHNLVLAKATDTVNGLSATNDRIAQSFEYHLEKIEGAADNEESYYNIIDASGNAVEGYKVDAYFNIKGEGVDTNLFCGDSPYFPWPTDFLYMTSSDDGGETWSVPTLIDVKRQDEQTLLVGPGRGIVTTMEDGTERIIFTAYDFTYGDDRSCAIYSDDGGKTWERGADVANWSSESVVTEADGRLYIFTRHGNCYYVSEDWGETWGPAVAVPKPYNSNCQLTAITYSEKVQGKTAILLAAPSSTSSRSAGKIYLALVEEDGSLTWDNEYSINGNGNYAYSCMDELSNGNIGLLYESAGAAITYTEIDKDLVLGYEKNITIDMGASYVEEKEADAHKEITQKPDETVATVTSEFIVEDAVVKLRDHSSDTASSLSSFAAEYGAYDAEDCEFTFTANGDYWQISNGDDYIDLSQASNYMGTATDLTIEKIDPDETVTGDETFRIAVPTGDGTNPRYAVFFTTKMVFDAWATSDVVGDANSNAALKFDLVLLEKQETVSEGDIVPGYARASEVKDGGVYLIGYIWGTDTEDTTDDGVIVLYPTNGQASQTKLVGGVEGTQKNVVTITGINPGETTAVVGGVTYNITVTDPTLSPSYEGNDYPVESLTAISDSQYLPGTSNEGPDDFILDGNAGTHWHTNWATTEGTNVEKRWVGVSLDEAALIGGIRYLPRNGNGAVTEYKVQYRATDDGAWVDAATGTWDRSDSGWKLVTFDAVTAKQVRIVGVHTWADSGDDAHMSTAEFRVTVAKSGTVTPPVEVDKAALKELLAAVAELKEADYTAESWADLEAALEKASAVNESADATQEEVTAAVEALQAAYDALKKVEKIEVTEVFPDIKPGVWYEENVQYVFDKGLMSGSEGFFNPTNNVKRSQVIVTLYRMAGSPEVTDRTALTELVDVNPEAYYADAVCWAYNEGVITGTGADNKYFMGSDDVKRQQLAAMFYRYAECMGYSTEESADISSMLNADKVSGYAVGYVKWAVGAGLISGSQVTDANGNVAYDLKPHDTASRAQLAAMLQRFCEAYAGNTQSGGGSDNNELDRIPLT